MTPWFVSPGEKPTAAWANAVTSFCRSVKAPTKDKKVSGGGSSAYVPWRPRFFTEGEEEALVYKCKFNLGTVNNVAASNWSDAFTLPSDDAVKFVVLTIATESGKVTGVSISLDSDAPSEDSVTKDAPPAEIKILLGAVGKSSSQMIVTANLSGVAAEVFRETRTAPAVGGEPFSRWWRWTF